MINNNSVYILPNFENFITNKHPDSPKEVKPYLAHVELIQAVNLAICLSRPLLLEGEAGCGKTLLAHDIAYKLGLPLYTWHVRSTSKAQDGLYSYDSILRLHDVQVSKLSQSQNSNPKTLRNPEDPKCYRKLGPIGKAFALQDCPAVVLIDEIDKADIDFPNDLLSVLDDPRKFEIPETGEEFKATHNPIVIITSNKEKGNLPNPFLRRCIYYFIEFPTKDFLQQIIEQHYKDYKTNCSTDEVKEFSNLSNEAIDKFLTLRNKKDLHKNPGTSEFLDWLKMLQIFHSTPYKSDQLRESVTVPYPELLFKLRADWLLHTKTHE